MMFFWGEMEPSVPEIAETFFVRQALAAVCTMVTNYSRYTDD